MQTSAWAVLAYGAQIYVKSVSETRRAAIINWLVVEKGLTILNTHTDAQVEIMWQHYGKYVDVKQVSISYPPISDGPSPE